MEEKFLDRKRIKKQILYGRPSKIEVLRNLYYQLIIYLSIKKTNFIRYQLNHST